MDEENNNKREYLTPREQQMAGANLRKLVLTYSIPTVIGMLVSALYVVVDRFFVAQIPGIGDDALAGITLASPVVLILGSVSLLIGVGSAAKISIRLGEGDRAGAERILGNCFTLNLICSITLGIIALIFLEPILRAFGASDATLPHAYTYTSIKLYGALFMYLSWSMNHPIRATGNAKRFASAQLIGAISNIFLNPLFIFTFDMGIAGAGWSTVLAQSLSAIWVMLYYFRGDPAIRIRLKNMVPHLKTILTIFSVGVAPFFMQILGSAVAIIANRFLMQHGGDSAVAAFGAIAGVTALFVMPVFGIAQGSQPIIGFNYGAGDLGRVKTGYFWAAIYAVSICVIGAILLMTFPRQIMGMFVEDPQALEIGATGMRIMAWTLPVAAFQMNASTFFMSIGKAKWSVLLSVMRQGVFLIPLYFILPQFMGVMGIWWSTPIADITAFSVALLLILRQMKQLGKTIKNA
ncbi:MAG: MATE family efflux transporter [Defluviitaleaceae bacterium]|nr:MATE family efflux transporter [Defluviitaleaceae bacterium]